MATPEMTWIEEVDDETPCCPLCGATQEWEDCCQCGGEGGYDAYELSPIEYARGEFEPCQQCGGEGGWWYCESEHASWHRAVAARAKS